MRACIVKLWSAVCAAVVLALSSLPAVDFPPIELFVPDRHSGLRGYAEHLYLNRYPSRLPPASDTYTRYLWRDLEPAPGVFDFSTIDQHLAAAAATGRKHSFRVYCVHGPEIPVAVPQYIVDQGLGQWGNAYVPLWNDSRVISAMQRLMQALGQRYDNDPRLSYIDFGLYGRWGEWHMAGIDEWLPRASLATRKQLVDIVVNAFPNTIKVMIPDSGETDGTLGQAFRYALEKSPLIGIRKDNLGNDWFDQEASYPDIAPFMATRWKTAPFITEFYGDWGSDLDKALDQAIRTHVSLIGANIDHDKMVIIGRRSGYRYRIASAWWPAQARPGSAAILTTKWFNDGIAPVYERWNIRYELWAAGATQAAYTKDSTLDLRTVLPGSILHADELSLPSSLAAGTYELRVAVLEHRGVRPPMHLAMDLPRREDGRYTLGQLTVSAEAATPGSATVTLAVVDSSMHEGGDSGAFRIQRSGGDTALPLLVNIALSGTASNGVDYRLQGAESSGAQGMVLIPAGATHATVIIEPIDDAQIEGLETIEIALAGGVGYTVGTTGVNTLLLADDDVAGQGIIAQDSFVYPVAPVLGEEHQGGFGWADRWYGYGSLVDGAFTRTGLVSQGSVHLESNGLWGRVGRTLAQPVPNGSWVAFLAQLKGWSPAIIEFKSSTDPTSRLDQDTLFRLVAVYSSIALTAAEDMVQGSGIGWKTLDGVSRDAVHLWVFRVASDRVDLYVNPDLTAASPPPQPMASLTIAELGGRSPLFRSISLFSEYRGDVKLDEFRVASSWTALVGTLLPSVALYPTTLSVIEGSAAQLTVVRNGSTSGALTVNLGYSGTATSGSDYTPVASVTIPNGASSATLSLATQADGVGESNETIIVTIQAASAYTVGTPASATVTIIDSGGSTLPVVTITATDAEAAETAAGTPANTGVFTITRTGATTAALTVHFTVSGTATEGSDYQPLGTSVTIPAGATSATLTVTPIDDTVVEGAETVIVTLAAGSGYTVGTPSSAIVTIADNDGSTPPSSGLLAYEGFDYAVGATALNGGTGWKAGSAWSGGTLASPGFTIAGVQTVGNVTLGTSNWGSFGRELAQKVTNGWVAMMVQATGAWGPIDFKSGSTISFQLQLDDNETLVLRSVDGSGGSVWSDTNRMLATPTLVVLQLDNGTVRLWLNPTPGATAPAANAASASGNSFGRPVEFDTLQFTGATSIKVDEIRVASSYAGLWSQAEPPPQQATVTIVATDAEAAETAAGTPANTGVFTITRTGATTAALAVHFTVSGTATEGSDYQPLGTSVTIPAGAASATLTVIPLDDTEAEGAETVIVTLAAGSGYTVGTPSSATVTIADNDTAQAAQVVAVRIFYNNSAFDGNNAAANAQDDHAIATDKQPLLPGGTATFANYTSYSKGINGIMVDIAGLPGTPLPSDFQCRIGNSNTPDTWAVAPLPSLVAVRAGAGTGGSHRVTLIWPDNQIQKTWLRVAVQANARTGLSQPYVFYVGNAIGESGDSTSHALVNATDQLGARSNPRSLLNPAPIDFRWDYNRDRLVNATDQLIARSHATSLTNALKLITVP